LRPRDGRDDAGAEGRGVVSGLAARGGGSGCRHDHAGRAIDDRGFPTGRLALDSRAMRGETTLTIWACAAALAAGVFGCGGGGTSNGDGGHVDGGGLPLWLGVVGTGQSLSVGAASNGMVFTSPSANNLKLSLGAKGMSWPIDANDPELSLTPLT